MTITENITELSVVVQWNEVDDSLPTTYIVTWSGKETNSTQSHTLIEQSSYTITGLTLDTVYTITVTVTNRCGTGPEYITSVSFPTDASSTASDMSPTIIASINSTSFMSTENPSTTTSDIPTVTTSATYVDTTSVIDTVTATDTISATVTVNTKDTASVTTATSTTTSVDTVSFTATTSISTLSIAVAATTNTTATTTTIATVHSSMATTTTSSNLQSSTTSNAIGTATVPTSTSETRAATKHATSVLFPAPSKVDDSQPDDEVGKFHTGLICIHTYVRTCYIFPSSYII